ncbi:MAG: polysaccharide deacetylase family protein [bacterium]
MRKIIAFVLYFYYYPEIKRRLNKKGVILSIYGHKPKGKSIDKVIRWLLKRGYNFITPNEILNFKLGTLKKAKPLWLSFDDGWKSNYYELLPILKKYAIPATIFISTKGIDDGYFWFNRAFENRKSPFFNKIDELWKMSNHERELTIEKLPKYNGPKVAMNKTELYHLAQSEFVFIANHTHDHVICNTCNKEELEREIKKCERKIKEFTNKGCIKVFSYPNGNYNQQTVDVLKKLKYEIAVTTNLEFIRKETDVYQIPRNVLPDDASFYESILQIYGLWTPFFNKIKKKLNIKSHK